ncbi:PREDICTED: uncharacterized protein LOC105452059 [Wasmannia auropunctata]|uniref:uncharacterized protein LOC105452059 n=1 Tax=Wasmannia auropunctata TaxID=64793 RepID=UPI0005EDE094|nr:PREDICTED: uncharacterized protein LOC105452059 [Wasmannia auropunctata]
MQGHFSVFIIFLVVALSILHSSEALRCHYQHCNAWTKSCTEEPPVKEVECLPSQTMCVKYTLKSYTGIGRGCYWSGFCESIKIIGYETCNECDSNLCNASAQNAVSIIAMITSGLITLLWTIKYGQ